VLSLVEREEEVSGAITKPSGFSAGSATGEGRQFWGEAAVTVGELVEDAGEKPLAAIFCFFFCCQENFDLL